MLELTKVVLRSVSFDKNLFKKELVKAKRWLKNEEVLALKAWCLATFGAEYAATVQEAFNALA